MAGREGGATRWIDLSGLSESECLLADETRATRHMCIFYHAIAPLLHSTPPPTPFNIADKSPLHTLWPCLSLSLSLSAHPIKHSKAWELGRNFAGVVDPLFFLFLSLYRRICLEVYYKEGRSVKTAFERVAVILPG